MENFRQSFRAILGPGIAMSARGTRLNRKLQTAMAVVNQEDSDAALKALRVMTDNASFNPNSPTQVTALIYDVLGAQPLPARRGRSARKSGARSADEKVLEIIRTQHPLVDLVIEKIWEAKKPANNVSKYGPNSLQLLNNRLLYVMDPIGTETGRWASRKSHLWIGTQTQNVPYEMRAMYEPDPGYVFFDVDYSKADFWHTAYASRDEKMLQVAADPAIDLHCHHASQFFRNCL
jgi:DNA polymerase I-like protein with 3'-5' exonuclease and polymerase domains